MRKKILFCATVDYHFKAFHLPIMRWFKEQGWEVHIAAAGDIILPYTDEKINIPIQRSPFRKENYAAYKQLRKVIDKNNYQIVHCHTPMGGVLGRLAARTTRKKGTKVLYTAHGFHFCKGAPLKNWILYYPIEKWLAQLTDRLITINTEDFNLASTKLQASINHVHGIGIDTDKFKPIPNLKKINLRKELNIEQDRFIMFYAAEFNGNKNQRLIIEALANIKDYLPNAKLLLAGEGPLMSSCKDLAKNLHVDHMIDFLGYRRDIVNLLGISDIAVASSLREGLPVNIMEAMSSGLPIIATHNRGHKELIFNNSNGWLVNNDPKEFSEKIVNLAANRHLIPELGEKGRQLIIEKYSLRKVLEEQSKIYSEIIKSEKEQLTWAAH
ncbi:glycosyltransferase family 4 protein [Peribacillus kribbensis]|uniref:glycosyltransferase family 4 protein n=1 Tax=Peribacillus kribbensis TaxID=356658 RepID=UPI00040423CD|nr:glycosyltransferase family 4 protein [Peribacillus kribbensis]